MTQMLETARIGIPIRPVTNMSMAIPNRLQHNRELHRIFKDRAIGVGSIANLPAGKVKSPYGSFPTVDVPAAERRSR